MNGETYEQKTYLAGEEPSQYCITAQNPATWTRLDSEDLECVAPPPPPRSLPSVAAAAV